jgi:ribosomal protein S25
MKDVIEIEGFQVSLGSTTKEKVLKYLNKNRFAFSIAVSKNLKIPISTALYILQELADEGHAIDMGKSNVKMNNRSRQVRLFKKA